VTALGIVIDLIGPINIGDEAQLKAASKPVSLSNGPLHKFRRNQHTFFSKNDTISISRQPTKIIKNHQNLDVGPANQLVRSLLWRDLYPVRFKFST
jgi:hypothetical protein